VFFRLTHRDEEFDSALKFYAGARELSATASGSNKRVYDDKALEHLRRMTRWLQEKLTTAYEFTYRGKTRSLGELLQTLFARAPSRAGVRDFVDVAAAVSLATRFTDTAPDSPIFDTPITRQNRGQA